VGGGTRAPISALRRECGDAVVEADGPAEARHLLGAGAKADIALIDLEATGELDGFGLAHCIRGRWRSLRARPAARALEAHVRRLLAR
jgi:hypothetical protein